MIQAASIAQQQIQFIKNKNQNVNNQKTNNQNISFTGKNTIARIGKGIGGVLGMGFFGLLDFAFGKAKIEAGNNAFGFSFWLVIWTTLFLASANLLKNAIFPKKNSSSG